MKEILISKHPIKHDPRSFDPKRFYELVKETAKPRDIYTVNVSGYTVYEFINTVLTAVYISK
jgi:hypothetical protein